MPVKDYRNPNVVRRYKKENNIPGHIHGDHIAELQQYEWFGRNLTPSAMQEMYDIVDHARNLQPLERDRNLSKAVGTGAFLRELECEENLWFDDDNNSVDDFHISYNPLRDSVSVSNESCCEIS